MNNPPTPYSANLRSFCKTCRIQFLVGFQCWPWHILLCGEKKRGWTGQLRGNPVELEDFPRVIDIYCEQSGRSAKVYIKTGSGVAGVEDQREDWTESCGERFPLAFTSHNKRYSDITAQSHVIGQETKFRGLISIIIIQSSYCLPLSDVGVWRLCITFVGNKIQHVEKCMGQLKTNT